MQKPSPDKFDMHSEEFLHSLMRKQLKLSIACALAFLVVLLGLPVGPDGPLHYGAAIGGR